MRLWLSWLGLVLLINPLDAGWKDIIDKINQVLPWNHDNNLPHQSPPLPDRLPSRIMESIQHMDVEKLRAGLRQLRKRDFDQLAKQKLFTNNGQVSPKFIDPLQKINSKSDDDDLLYQKDIILSQKQLDDLLQDNIDDDPLDQENRLRRKRQAEADGMDLWADNKVSYFFDASVGNQTKALILGGIAIWQNNTCVDFVEDATARARIRFIGSEVTCYSGVGSHGGQQDVSIGTGCPTVGIVAHELGHALGFWHQMARYDRDDYITIDWAKISPDYISQFNEESPQLNDNYGMPYDWASIMQYGATITSANHSLPSVFAKNPNYQEAMGSDIVAFYDISMMNERYGCKAKCPSNTSAQCYNGGFAHPRNCSICLCPRGFGGPQCADRAQIGDCGDYLKATTTPQNLSSSVDAGSPASLFSKRCSYLIYADTGMQIEVTIVSIASPWCTDGCVRGGLELKAATDLKMSGYRYCCENDAGTVVNSTFNALPVINWSLFGKSDFTISYRAVLATSSNQGEPPRLTILNNTLDH